MRRYWGYSLYMALCLIFTGPIFIAPFIAAGMPAVFNFLQDAYAPACHQLAERSLCYFQNGTVADCAQPGIAVAGKQRVVDAGGILGYKFPVCTRDLAIYGAMLLGGLLFLFVRRIDERELPSLIYFVLALVPIALDGGTQLVGLRESSTDLRLLTGFIAGIAVPFYVIPMLNMFILGTGRR